MHFSIKKYVYLNIFDLKRNCINYLLAIEMGNKATDINKRLLIIQEYENGRSLTCTYTSAREQSFSLSHLRIVIKMGVLQTHIDKLPKIKV